MSTTVPALPEPGQLTPDDRVLISRRFIRHARAELEQGHRLQAAEKAWGAMAQMLKAYGEQRGWQNTGSHQTVKRIALHLDAEYAEIPVAAALVAAEDGQTNFYDNRMDTEEILAAITTVAKVLPDLARALHAPPRPFTIRDAAQRWRVRVLTGGDWEIGDTSPVGFSNTHRGNVSF